jgi:hypothetical protein
MPNEKSFYIFICFIPGTKQYFAGRQHDIDLLITQFENSDQDLPFTTVARIKEIGENRGVPIGFPEQLIEWYEKDKKPTQRDIDGAVNGIVTFLQRGFVF